MFGDYIDRGGAGAIFSSPTNPDQVIKIINLDALDDFVKPMNNQQFEFFEKLEEQQKQGITTPGLPNIGYTFTGEMTPEIMGLIQESSPSDVYPTIKGNFRYGDKYAIILMDRVSNIADLNLGRLGLTPMLRHVYNMGYYVRDLWPDNKGMGAKGQIIWFDPIVAPVRATNFEEREAQRILLEWNEDTQRRYLEAIDDNTYFDFEHKAGLFYSEDEEDKVFGVQRHDAHRAGLHYDLRLERDGVLKSWSIPKGMPTDKRHLAIATPDHKMSWLEFEGDIPKGSYGAGNVKLDNKSTFKTISYSKKKWVFFVNAGKYKGKYTLVHWKDNKWLITMNKDQSFAAEEERFDSEDDNYWLRGGCGKAAGLISEQLDKQKIPHHYEIGLAYLEDAFIGNHIIVIAQGQDRTYEMDFQGVGGAKQRWEDMMIADLDNPKLPRSMIDDIIRFEWHPVDPNEDWSVEIAGEYLPVSGPMITKDTLSMSAEDENRYHDCATCNRKNVDNEESDEDDSCHMVGCGNYFCYQCMNSGNTPTFSLGDHEDSKFQETYFGGSSPSVGKCCLEKAINLGFRMYSGYGGDEGWLERLVEDGHLPNRTYVSINYVRGGVDKMSAESYPTCYLCAKPAKIEVMTAIGMRNFCGNECRGNYEGIDYGPDDYFISPKLEHDIELVSYDPGYIGGRSGRSATLYAKCRNCDFTTLDPKGRNRNQSFYQHHLVKTLKEWDEDAQEWWDTGQKCRHDKMQYLDYLENGEDAWGNVIAGHIVIGCPTCGFKDTLSHVDIPQGCDNRGRIDNYIQMPK